MVNLTGHLGMALVWALPVWFFWSGRVSVAFIGFVLSSAMLPDVDLVLQTVLPITHHGITHTVLFVAIVSLVAGALVERAVPPWLGRVWLQDRGRTVPERALFVFVFGGLLLGGFSHLFADTLSAPDVAKPLTPFWPLIDEPWAIDLIWYGSPWWNAGLLVVGIALHVALAYTGPRVDHPWGFRSDQPSQPAE